MAAHFIQRTLHTAQGCLRARAPRRANPGLAYQLQQLEEQEHNASSAASEDYADMESDFMSAHQTHRQHEVQQQEQRDRIRQFMIKHKYFRNAKLPNLLLHAEKEQMRLLHARDPEEWNIERLAESFPATPDIVDKVLRAKWRPQNLQRIRMHDESVMRNWSELRAGKCEVEIPKPLLEHLQKFGQRQRMDLQQMAAEQWPTKPQLPVPKNNEFRALIAGPGKQCTPAQQTQLTAGQQPRIEASDEEETYLLDKVQNKRKMRLQELKALKLVPQLEKEAQVPQNPSGTGQLPSLTQKFESSEIVISVADQQRYEMTKVKERIIIPRKLHRKGATYRVQDAYYDDDGEFLYRVPGMTGVN